MNPLITSKYAWVFQYKLYHIPFWALYHYIWWTIFDGDVSNVTQIILFSPYVAKYLFYVFFQAFAVYFVLYYLIPTFLNKGKNLIFLLSLLLTICTTAICILGGYYLSAYLLERDVFDVFLVEPASIRGLFLKNSLPSTVSAITLGLSIKLAKNHLEAQKREQELEKEKLETELKFLKSQFNPHFLFNTINSIFVLIHKNKDLASESLAKFSNLLRYQLYECNEALIPLQLEISYIESFIELEKLRLDEGVVVEVVLPTSMVGDQMVAPFVLMPFIENAFKYVSKQKDKANYISIQMQVDQSAALVFKVKNSKSVTEPQSRDAVNYGGLGLSNVKRRLALLYQSQYDLSVVDEVETFEVVLQLNLKTKSLNNQQIFHD